MDFYADPHWKRSSLGSTIGLFACRPISELTDKSPILLIGGVHGDEPEGVRLAQDTLDWLTREKESQLCPWVIIPCLNVDGFRSGQRVNGRGVDLNRNYPSVDWSPEYSKARYFPGPSAASEPEIQGMIELIQTLRPRLLIHCHSWNPCIVATGSLAETDGRRLARSSGYQLMGEIGYPTPGSLSRYGWHDHQIPVICIEEQDDLENLNSIWPRFQAGMREIFIDHSPRK